MDDLRARLYHTTRRQTRQLGGLGWAVFQIADTIQRAAVETTFDALALRPSAAGRVAGAVNDQVWESLTLLPAGRSSRLPIEEAQAAYRVFTLVSDVRRAVGLPPGPFSLLDALDRASTRLGFESLWAVEGLGHEYARLCCRAGVDTVSAMLRDPRIPRRYLNMLHAGLGLFFAEVLLNGVSPYSTAADVAQAVRRFIDRIVRNAVEGVEGPAFESLGLVTRTWYSDMTDSLSRALPGDLAGYFWHGAGRALYFLPIHSVPGLRSAWLAAEREARDPESGLNLRAGLAWAATLVNVEAPRLLESVIRLRAELLGRDAAFAYGVRTAVAMAEETSPGNTALRAFVEYAPGDETIADSWDAFVREPARDGIRLAHLSGRSPQPFLGRAFRYRFPWDEPCA